MLNDWYALGGVQYRKWHIYDLPWTTTVDGVNTPINLENYLVCGGPFGGPVAMILDSKRLSSGATAQPPVNDTDINKLLLFTSSGIPLAQIDWNERSVIGMGWTDQENLVVIADDGMRKLHYVVLLA
jgi:vacuolar protein sorting-associated protein 16